MTNTVTEREMKILDSYTKPNYIDYLRWRKKRCSGKQMQLLPPDALALEYLKIVQSINGEKITNIYEQQTLSGSEQQRPASKRGRSTSRKRRTPTPIPVRKSRPYRDEEPNSEDEPPETFSDHEDH
jgi:hypothetical protein